MKTLIIKTTKGNVKITKDAELYYELPQGMNGRDFMKFKKRYADKIANFLES